MSNRAERVRASSARRRRLPQPITSDRRAWSWLMGWEPTGPRRATREEAVGYPPFERCIDLVASSVAAVDMQAGKKSAAGVWQRLEDQPSVCADPDPDWDPWQWRYACVRDLEENGNHISLLGDLDHRTGRPGWLVPLPAEYVGVVERPDEGTWDYVCAGAVLPRESVLHIKRGSRSGEILGRGLVDQFAAGLRTAVTAEEWAGRYLEGGGLPPALIQSRTDPGKPQADEFKARWRELLTTGEAAVLPADLTVTPLVTDAMKQQLVEARQWNAQVACIMTGVPTWMLGLPGPTMTYQNVDTADVAWRAYTLDRYAQPINRAFDKHLMPHGTTVRSQWAGLERTDAKTQAEVSAIYVQSGILSRDEVRMRLQYAPQGDTYSEGTTPEGTPELGPQEV